MVFSIIVRSGINQVHLTPPGFVRAGRMYCQSFVGRTISLDTVLALLQAATSEVESESEVGAK